MSPSNLINKIDAWINALRSLNETLLKDGLVHEVYDNSPHFHPGSVELALRRLIESSSKELILNWLAGRSALNRERIVVLNASNIPFVGFRDLLAVNLSGHHYVGVLSRRSKILLPTLAEHFNDSIKENDNRISFSSFGEGMDRADRIIATGSNQTISTIKEQCAERNIPFNKCIFRGHKIGVAAIDKHGLGDSLEKLAEDVLLYDGRGCRSVSIVFVPKSFMLDQLAKAFDDFRKRFQASRPCTNALEMPSAFLRSTSKVSGARYISGSGFLLSEGPAVEQNAGHLRIVRYESVSEIETWLKANAENIQHLGSDIERLAGDHRAYPLGIAQSPPLAWDPDGIDILEWLTT